MEERKWERYTVTAALPYANGPIHLGHFAGVYLPADTYVRYLKSNKRDVLFICGSDEHGVPITIKAKKENKSPQEVVDYYHQLMKKALEDAGVQFSHYGRTSSKTHHETASAFFKKMYAEGKFVEMETDQYYDEEAKQFLADRYIVGTCPKCGNENAYGDQCEKCGTSLAPTDLIHPKSTLSGSKPVLRKTKNWFLPLDKLQGNITDFIAQHSDWKVNVYGQCKSWLDAGDGLQPRSMTRDLDWGIPVPLPDAEGKVLYVWFDAPIGYISNTKELLGEDGVNKYWKDKGSRLIHFIGKDNIVFHCIIFPAMLMEHGEFILPDNVPGNEFLNLEGNKLSTSKNWAVWLHEYLEDFGGKQDELRYVLTSIAPETKDSEFTWKDYQQRVNNELVAILGNLVNRVMVLCDKYFEGKVPVATPCSDLEKFITTQKELITTAIENFRFREGLAEVMNIARHGNQLLSDKEPWKLIKVDKEATAVVLYDCLQIMANLMIACEPFLPFTAAKIAAMLNVKLTDYSWSDIGRQDLVKPNHQLGTTTLLYTKIEDEQIAFQLNKLHTNSMQKAQENNTATKASATEKPLISFDDFAKLDLRVGKILAAEKVEKADKLLQFTVDMGYEKRTIVSGIAAHFTPEETIGQLVTVVANLAPRKIRGVESKGMILLAENENGKLIFIAPNKELQPGSVVS